MKGTPLVAAVLCFSLASPAHAQATKQKRQEKDDLPDVSLVVPEDARPEVKAIIKDNALALCSTRASDRLKAAQVFGELGEAGKPVRGLLCRAMLDPVPDVRVAAADALKSIDPKMQYLAVTLVTEKDTSQVRELLRKIEKLEEDGEPLASLVANGAILCAAAKNENNLLGPALEALSHIARNDLPSCRLIASALANPDAQLRVVALRALVRMKHGKLAVPQILALLKTDSAANRVVAIETLAGLADESTEEVIAGAIATQRYDDEENARKAVEVALNKLQNRVKP